MKVDIVSIFTDSDAFQTYHAFLIRVVDVHSYKFSKKERQKLKAFYDKTVELGSLKENQYPALLSELREILDSFDFKLAHRRKKEQVKRREEKKKTKNFPLNFNIYRKSTSVTIEDELPKKGSFSFPKVSEVHDNSYYSNLRKSLKPQSGKFSDLLESSKDRPKVGLGIDSEISVPRIKSDDVVIDQHTKSDSRGNDSHYLYSVGWSAKGHFIDNDPDDETS